MEQPLRVDQLIEQLESRMIATLWRLLRNQHDAEDALQTAVTTIWRQRTQIERHANPPALILKICADTGIDELRRRTARRAAPLGAEWAGDEISPETVLQQLPAGDPSPHDAASARELREQLSAGIGRLPRNQAIAITMRYLQGASYLDIASALGCGEATVRTHAARGRERLADWLKHWIPVGGRGSADTG